MFGRFAVVPSRAYYGGIAAVGFDPTRLAVRYTQAVRNTQAVRRNDASGAAKDGRGVGCNIARNGRTLNGHPEEFRPTAQLHC